MKRSFTPFLLIAGLLLMAGCAGSKAVSADTIVGTWDYTIEGPGSPSTGTFTIEQSGEELVGEITGEALNGDIALSDIVFENKMVSFKFDSGRLGEIAVRGTVDGSTLSGSIDAVGYEGLPLMATKQMGN
ncbi:MAG: hypothetical protein AAGJ10_04350 [Bacteroidota bacterium]